eukprot:COSAG06_NODE_2379_length_6982_cov_7.713035_4_plen_96_part_00
MRARRCVPVRVCAGLRVAVRAAGHQVRVSAVQTNVAWQRGWLLLFPEAAQGLRARATGWAAAGGKLGCAILPVLDYPKLADHPYKPGTLLMVARP